MKIVSLTSSSLIELSKYNEKVKSDYEDNPNLNVLSQSRGLVVGSNSFAVVLANETLDQEGLRTATQVDLELILKHRRDLNLRGTYEDTGLVLRSEGEPNSYLARDLSRQLKARDPDFKYPVLIHLKDLSLRIDQDSKDGLAFNLKEEAKPIYAPILNSSNGSKFSSSNIDEATGLPRQVGEDGERYLFTRGSGLSRFFLDTQLNLNSISDSLDYSDSYGRVVVKWISHVKIF